MKTDDFEKEKAIWKNAEKHEQKLIPDVSNFDSLYRNRFTTAISHIKRNFAIECFAAVFSLGFLWVVSFTHYKETVFFLLVSFFSIAGLMLAFYFYRSIYSIKTHTAFHIDIKKNLQETLARTEDWVKKYKKAQKVFGYILLPPLIIVAYRYMYSSYTSNNLATLYQYLSTWQSILFLSLCTAFLIFYGKIIDKLINRTYKKHIDFLRATIDDIINESI